MGFRQNAPVTKKREEVARELAATEEFYFQWHITERCNKRCRHCYQNGHQTPELPLHDLEVILAKMDQALRKWGRQGTLSLTGGEPLVRQADLLSLMERIDQTNSFAYYDLLTNGSLISEATTRELLRCGKLRRVQVSLEGSSPSTNDAIRGDGSHHDTLRAIRLLKRHGVTVSVMTTLSRLNSSDIPSLFQLLESEGVDTFALERLIPEGSGKALQYQILSPDELRKVYEAVYQMAAQSTHTRVLLYRPLFAAIAPEDPTAGALCSAGNNALTVMPDGTVYPCRRLPIPIGNVLSDGFFSIWYDSEVLWNIRNPEKLGSKCRECDLLAVCRGCRAMAYACSADYMAEDPQCWR